MSESIDPQTQTMIDNMPEKTGKSLPAWFQIIGATGAQKHGEIMKLLKGEYGVTHGYANTISILYRQQLAGGASSDSDLVDAQYAGAKAGLKPIYEVVMKAVSDFGPDIEIAPKKSYVSLRRGKQFAIVKAATYYNDPAKLLEASEELGMGMPGLDISKLDESELLQTRGW